VAQINLEKLSLKELLDLETRLRPAIHEAQTRERAKAREKIDTLARDMGFSVQELFGSRRGKGGTVKAKYCNPDNPAETWTGRGRTPNWLRAKLDKGAKLETYLIR
jgi:DNA-binding protein H-NS